MKTLHGSAKTKTYSIQFYSAKINYILVTSKDEVVVKSSRFPLQITSVQKTLKFRYFGWISATNDYDLFKNISFQLLRKFQSGNFISFYFVQFFVNCK